MSSLRTCGCVLLMSFALAACSSRKSRGGGAEVVGPVDQVYLVALPVAVNLDPFPGNDGFAVKVYLGNRALPKTFPVSTGVLELVTYDGLPKAGASRDPLRVWRFTPEELRPREIRGVVGIGYSFALQWEHAAPKERKITVFARYTSPEGVSVSSAVTPISVAD